MNLNDIFLNDIFLFDVDDTLLYTFQNGFLKINAAAQESGCRPITFDEYRFCYGRYSFEECLRIWFPSCNVEQLSRCYSEQKSKFPYKPICDFGILQKKLINRGIQCGILTNGYSDKKLFEKLQLSGVILSDLIGVWGKEDLPFPKPDSRALLPVKKLYPSRKLVYFGDAVTDYQMCREGNVAFVQVLSGKENAISNVISIRDITILLEYLS